MVTPERAFGVDTDEVAAAARSFDEAAATMGQAVKVLREVRATTSEWAVDGNLAMAVGRLLDVLEWAAAQAKTGVGELGDRLQRCGDGYDDAERSAALVREPG